MSSYFDEASLVMIPSGYKDQKVYSIKPLDGAGDLTFSRASSATRVASNGYIEKVRTNLVLQSQDFATTWTTYQATITANAAVAPDGTTTADKIEQATGILNSVAVQQVTVALGELTLSAYLKAGTTSLGKLGLNTTNWLEAVYDLSNGTIVSTSTGATSTITSVGNGWYRCSITRTGTNTTSYLNVGCTPQVGEFVYAWGCQLEQGVMTDYIATTSAAVSVGPVSGLPRLDYLNSTCPRLLLEPSRTSLVNYSEQLNNAYWTQNATVTANSTISPSGYQDADTLTDSTNAFLDVRRSFTITASTAYTFSIFVKKTTGTLTNYAGAGFSAGGGAGIGYAIFNTTTGAVNLADVAGDFVVSAKSTSYGDYYRFEVTFTTGQTSLLVLIYPALSQNGTTLSSDAQGSNVFWGAQLEEGAYATSYIPTLGTSVTRVADAASKTGISSLIGQTEGTIFAEINFDLGVTAFGDSRIQLSDGTTSNWIFIGIPDGQSSNLVRIYVNAPSGAMSAYSTNPLVSGLNKIAFGYKSGSFVLYINGVQAATSSTTLTMAACSRIDLQGAVPSAATAERTNYKQVLLFKTRLTNAQLAELTTL